MMITNSLMCVDACISSSTRKVFTFTVWNVLTVRVFITLGKAEINNEDAVFSLIVSSNQEVIRLDVSMNDAFFMNFFNTFDLNQYLK